MNKHEILDGAGKQIIKILNEYNQQVKLDDTEYLPIVKRVIEALSIYLKDNIGTDELSKKLNNTLIAFTKELYIELCQKHAVEDVTMEEVRQESGEYFDYVYKHEEHPR